jgi:hypothetical protein
MEANNLTIAHSAAKWWADQLRATSDELWQSGDDLSRFLLSKIPRSHNDACVIQKFQDSLEGIIQKYLLSEKNIVLDVGYYPDYYLMEAIKTSGVKVSGIDLPLKTKMFVDQSNVIIILINNHFIELSVLE